MTAVLLALFGAWLASFAGFLMPSQMQRYVVFDQWQGIGVALAGVVDFACISLLRRPYAWLAPVISAGGLAALQLTRLAVFGKPYLDTDWWVTFTAVVIAGVCGFVAVCLRP